MMCIQNASVYATMLKSYIETMPKSPWKLQKCLKNTKKLRLKWPILSKINWAEFGQIRWPSALTCPIESD